MANRVYTLEEKAKAAAAYDPAKNLLELSKTELSPEVTRTANIVASGHILDEDWNNRDLKAASRFTYQALSKAGYAFEFLPDTQRGDPTGFGRRYFVPLSGEQKVLYEASKAAAPAIHDLRNVERLNDGYVYGEKTDHAKKMDRYLIPASMMTDSELYPCRRDALMILNEGFREMGLKLIPPVEGPVREAEKAPDKPEIQTGAMGKLNRMLREMDGTAFRDLDMDFDLPF